MLMPSKKKAEGPFPAISDINFHFFYILKHLNIDNTNSLYNQVSVQTFTAQ